jgi:hypothetical protein
MTDEKKSEIVTSVKMSDLISQSRQKVIPDSALFFVAWWVFYFWFFVFETSQLFSLTDTKALSTPELVSGYERLQVISITAALFMALLPFAGYAICWASLTHAARDNFLRKVINTFPQVFLAALGKAALLLVVYAVCASAVAFFVVTRVPEQLKNFFWLGALVVLGGFVFIITAVLLLTAISALYLYFSNLVRKLAISAL